MATRAWTQREKFRSGILAVAVSAVIVVGSLTGAQLKTDQQKDEAIKQFRETPFEEQIAALESQKTLLQREHAVLQKKLDLFQERVEERRQELAKKAK